MANVIILSYLKINVRKNLNLYERQAVFNAKWIKKNPLA